MKHLFNLLLLSMLTVPMQSYAYSNPLINVVKGRNIANHQNVLFGHVLDKNTGNYLLGATLTIKETNQTSLTDSTGHYRFYNLEDGVLHVEASFPGYISATQKIKVKGDLLHEINFELKPNEIKLNQAVVSANRIATTRKQAPTLVGVISNTTVQQTQSQNLAQALNFQSGVRVENNCQNCGFSQVRINGLDGKYSQILIDSRPMFTALAGIYGLEMMPTNMIDRVEIVRGGGSALFGSSAIGGTINVITKTPTYNSASFSHTTGLFLGSTAFQNTTNFNASLVSSSKKAGLVFFGQNKEQKPYDSNGDGFSERPQSKDQALGFRSFLRLAPNQKLNFAYYHLEEKRRGGNNMDLPPHLADICEAANYNVNGGELSYALWSKDGSKNWETYFALNNTDRNSFYGDNEHPDAYGNTHNLSTIIGSQYNQRFHKLFFLPAQLTAGVEHTYEDLSDETLAHRNDIHQKIHNTGIFLQNEWKSQYLNFLVGLRMDKHSLIKKAILSPRVNIKFKPIEDLSIRATYASGFRAPQAFDEDLHVSSVQGELKLIQNDPNLKEERSNSFSLSADYYLNLNTDWQANFILEGFYTKLTDAFANEETSVENPLAGYIYEVRKNKEQATVQGVMLEAKIAYKNSFQLQTGFTWQRSKYKEAVNIGTDENPILEKEFIRTPNTYGYVTATYLPTPVWKIALSGVYTGKMLVPHSISDEAKEVNTSPHFFDLGLKISRDFRILNSTDLQLYAGIKNIFNDYQKDFDLGATRDATYIYGPLDPRNIYLGLKLEF